MSGVNASNTPPIPAPSEQKGLLCAPALLKEIWPDEQSRPSLRWLRSQTAKRTIPYLKIGHRVFFNPVKVKRALDLRFTVDHR